MTTPDVDIYLTVKTAPREWMSRGRCNGMSLGEFFLGRGNVSQYAAALAACRSCPVRIECATYANTEPLERHGIWGGLTARLRARVRSGSISIAAAIREMDSARHGSAARWSMGCQCGPCGRARRDAEFQRAMASRRFAS